MTNLEKASFNSSEGYKQSSVEVFLQCILKCVEYDEDILSWMACFANCANIVEPPVMADGKELIQDTRRSDDEFDECIEKCGNEPFCVFQCFVDFDSSEEDSSNESQKQALFYAAPRRNFAKFVSRFIRKLGNWTPWRP